MYNQPIADSSLYNEDRLAVLHLMVVGFDDIRELKNFSWLFYMTIF